MSEHPHSGRPARSALGLGPLETAIMRTFWAAGCRLTIRDVRERMDYPWVAYTTAATVVKVLHRKGLLSRLQEHPRRGPGSATYWYEPACRPARLRSRPGRGAGARADRRAGEAMTAADALADDLLAAFAAGYLGLPLPSPVPPDPGGERGEDEQAQGTVDGRHGEA